MFKKKKIFDYFFSIIGKIESNYPKDPFGTSPKANKEYYINLLEDIKKIIHPEIDKFEAEMGFSIDLKWIEELALFTQITIKKSKLNYQHGRLLYSSLRNYIKKNEAINFINILETGTSRGFSTICMSKAINDGGVNGKIITYDILPHNKKMYWNIFLDNEGTHTRKEILNKWKEETKNIIFIQGSSRTNMLRNEIDRINYAFLDAEHTLSDVLSEYRYVSERQLEGDIIVFDDVTIGTFDGVVKALNKIELEGKYNVKYIKSSDARGYAIAYKKK